STLASGLVKPVDVAVSPDGAYLYVAEDGDPFVNQIRRIDLADPGSSTVIAGGASSGYGGDGGPATGAVFWGIAGIDVGPDGDVFIADQRNNRIRRIDVDTGTISLVAGTGGCCGGGDGGPATAATIGNPMRLSVDAAGWIWIAAEAE